MQKIIFYILGLGLMVSMALVFAIPAKAANTGIQISPVTFNFDIKPGESQTGNILITNRNDETMDYTMELEIFDNSSETGVPSFTAVAPQEGVSTFADWVTFPDGKSGSVAVGQSTTVNFTITLPANVEPGGHYGAIFAKQTKPLISGQNEVGVAARVGALVLVSVPGQTTQGSQIKDFYSPRFVWRGPVDFSMRVENTGSVHFDSNAVIKIKNLWGAEQKIDMGTHTILPKSIRLYEKIWETKYPFGYYKITPTATDGNGAVITGATVALIAIPLIIVIPAIVGLILIIWLIVYLKRHVRIVQ